MISSYLYGYELSLFSEKYLLVSNLLRLQALKVIGSIKSIIIPITILNATI